MHSAHNDHGGSRSYPQNSYLLESQLSSTLDSFLINRKPTTARRHLLGAEAALLKHCRSPARSSSIILVLFCSSFKTCKAILINITLMTGLTELYRGDDPVVEHVKKFSARIKGLLMRIVSLPYTDLMATPSLHGPRRDPKRCG